MDKFILVIITMFFILGGIDYILNNKFGIGNKFKEGISSIGLLVLSMTGIFAISPIIGDVLSKICIPIGEFLGIDLSIFPAMFLAIDMGALGISSELAGNVDMYIISGVIVASTLGATLSFSIPLALGVVDNEYSNELSVGIIYGIATMPFSAIVAGLMLEMNLGVLFKNLLPLFILTGIIILGMLKFKENMENIFNVFSKGILILSLLALIMLGINSILGKEIIKGMIPISESLAVAGKIGIFLAGAYPLLEIITRYCSKYLSKFAQKIKLSESSIISILAGLVSNIIIFQNFDKLDRRGRIVCSAFSVSGAFVLGGQLGFVSSEVPEAVTIYIISKLLAGVLAIMLAYFMTSREVVHLK
ncbi:MAG: ethanolamine utilization protein EutH [Sarcina sp.]